MEVGEAHPLGVQSVEVRRLQHRVAVGGHVAVALIVGEDEDDVRLLAGERIGGGSTADRAEKYDERKGEGAQHGEPPGERETTTSAGLDFVLGNDLAVNVVVAE